MEKKNALADLVAKLLNGELGCSGIDAAAMDKQPGGFVDRHQPPVTVEDFQFWRRCFHREVVVKGIPPHLYWDVDS